MHAPIPPIPRHETEVVQAEATRRWQGRTDKVATTSLDSMSVNGVLLRSRYGKADEYRAMSAMALAIPPAAAGRIKSIFCDSKAGLYCVSMPVWHEGLAREVGAAMEAACFEARGGHNGILVSNTSELIAGYGVACVEMGAMWQGDFED